MASQDDKPTEFLLQEFTSLRAEMDEAVKETRALERWALAAVAAIWTWLATHPTVTKPYFWWMPVLVVGFFWFRTFALRMHIDGLAKYLMKIEAHFQLPKAFGFERHFACSPERMVKRLTGHAFWIILFGATILVVYLAGTCGQP